MTNFELSDEQHLLQTKIGIEKSVDAFAKNFFVPGKPVLRLPRVAVSSECEWKTSPAVFSLGDVVPVIYFRSETALFDMASWEVESHSNGSEGVFRKAEQRSLGFPALIPASYVDIAVDARKRGGKVTAIRLREKMGKNLYLAATFTCDRSGVAQTVTPIVCKAHDDVATYVDWQPLFIKVDSVPGEANFEFLSRQDNGRLQAPGMDRAVQLVVSTRIESRDFPLPTPALNRIRF